MSKFPRFDDRGIGRHNMCRNPEMGPENYRRRGPWCYNALGKDPQWGYCEIPDCSELNRYCYIISIIIGAQ